MKKKLNDLKEGENITFEQMLSSLGLPAETYILSIRSSLKLSNYIFETQAK